jgi:hypothetical protein
MRRTVYGIVMAMLLLASIIFGISGQIAAAVTPTSAQDDASGLVVVKPDKTSNPGDTVKLTGPAGSYTYSWTVNPTISPAPTGPTTQTYTIKIPKTTPAALYTVTLLVKSTLDGSCTNSRDILIAVNAVNVPIAISGKKSICVTAVNEPYTVTPDLTTGQTITWSLDGTPLDAKYNTNPTAITWADFASGITVATTKNLVAVVKDSAGNVVSTAPTFSVVVVPIPDTTITVS